MSRACPGRLVAPDETPYPPILAIYVSRTIEGSSDGYSGSTDGFL